jgi:hypothetical protein
MVWAAGADWAGALATIDSGVADGTVAVDWTPGGDSPYGSVVARVADVANYIVAYYWGGTLYLYRIATTGNVLLASTAIDNPGTATHRLTMVLAGTSIQVRYDGILRLSATDAFNLSATRHGFRWLSYYDWQSIYANFRVDGVFVPIAAVTVVTPTPTQVPLFKSATLTATAYDASHNVIPDMSFSWSTSNSTAVSVAALSATCATVIGVGAGAATITATPVRGSSSTATVTVNTGPVAIFDTFVGSDSIPLASHAPDVDTPGGAWSTNGSGAFLIGSRASAGGADWNPITASIDSALADGVVEVDWTPGGADTPAATIIARMTNASNYLLAHYWSDTLWLYRVASDRYTLLGQAAVAEASGAMHHLALKLAGAAIEVWWDGVQQIVASDAFNATATRHGFRWYSWWDWQSTYDHFEVSALPTIASVTITPSTATIPMNGGRIFTAQAFDTTGDPIAGVSFTWQSSDPAAVSTRVASATMAATVAESVGSATVTAIAFGGGPQQSVAVTVTASTPPPPPPGCTGGVFPTSATWPADGGIGHLTVSAPSNCEWTADWNAAWITPLQTSGNGNANLPFAIDRNDSGVTRSGTLTISGGTLAITQTNVFTGDPLRGSDGGPSINAPPSACQYTVSPFIFVIGSGGGTYELTVRAPAGCSNTILSAPSWTTFSQTSGTGTWTTTVAVAPNSTVDRRLATVTLYDASSGIDQSTPGMDAATFQALDKDIGGADPRYLSMRWELDAQTNLIVSTYWGCPSSC